MPGKTTHLFIGAIAAGAIAHWALPESCENRGWKIAGAMFVGAAASRLPDLLEPAINPNHRSLFHGLLTAVGIAYGGKKTWNYIKGGQRSEKELWLALTSLAAASGYGSHLVADAFTPKSLPLIA